MASTSFALFLSSHLYSIVCSDDGINMPISIVRPSNRIRLYSIKTFKSLGTLDYHKDGVQAVTFARSAPSPSRPGARSASVREGDGADDGDEDEEFSNAEIEARKRWLVAGGKDGRISVWELMDFAKPKP
jgi:WD40 repeat protein